MWRDLMAPIASSSSPKFVDWIKVSEDSDHPDIFFLGAADNRITFYSQQVRALRLVHALAETGRLKASDRVAIVGAGAPASPPLWLSRHSVPGSN